MYSKHNVASFSLCLGVALIPRSGDFLADDNKPIALPLSLSYLPISQAYSSILP